jgi:uncharacterized protein (DUF58 family)
MKRLLYLSFRFFYSIKYRITRRFTAAGLLVLGGLAASAVVGIDTNQTVAYQIFTFLLSLVAVSLAATLFFRGRFAIKRVLPRFGTVGENLSYTVVVQNLLEKRHGGLFVCEDFGDMRPTFKEFSKTSEPFAETRNRFDRAIGYHRWLWLIYRRSGARVKEYPAETLAPKGTVEIPVNIVPLSRGRLSFDALIISRPEPFGLSKSSIRISAQQSLMVLPKRYPLPPIRLPGTRRYQSGGVALASSVGDSEEFVTLRDYRPGDPLRRIHWRSWAKTDKPIVKEHQDEFFVRHALILDTFQEEIHGERFEAAVSVAASFACSIQTQESLLDLMFVGTEAYCFTSGRGLAHTDGMLEILASVTAITDKSFSVLPPIVYERAGMLSGSICILLSWDEDRKAFIGHLKNLGVPVLVLVITDSATQPKSALDLDPMAEDPENFHRIEVGKIQEGLANL